MLDNPLEAMETYLAAQPSAGDAIEIPASLYPKEPVATFIRHDDANGDDTSGTGEVLPAELMQLPDFQSLWTFAHMGLGGYVASRTGADCSLADLAGNEAGLAASEEVYKQIEKSPFLSRMILEAQGGMMGLAMALVIHGGNCVSVIRESAKTGNLTKKQEAESEGLDHEQG
ncbi:hypothetical protein JI58_02260 [Marinosulfonomonas sp. PRT-SC04]|nr:hypothetical protein JI58_02260 [Marinosulfonomonas sp. PRT-SC04]